MNILILDIVGGQQQQLLFPFMVFVTLLQVCNVGLHSGANTSLDQISSWL